MNPLRRDAAVDYPVGSLVSRDGSRNDDGSEARFVVLGVWRGSVRLFHRASWTTTCASPSELEIVGAATPDSRDEAESAFALARMVADGEIDRDEAERRLGLIATMLANAERDAELQAMTYEPEDAIF